MRIDRYVIKAVIIHIFKLSYTEKCILRYVFVQNSIEKCCTSHHFFVYLQKNSNRLYHIKKKIL